MRKYIWISIIVLIVAAASIVLIMRQRDSPDNVYQDPEDRFSMTFTGEWTPVETDGNYAQFTYADMPLHMSLVTIEARARLRERSSAST